MEVLLHLARHSHRLTQVAQSFSGSIELRLALLQPVLHCNVTVIPPFVDVQLVRGVHGDRVLHLLKQLFVIDDMAIVLVVAVEAIGAANSLEQVVIAQLVVEVDVGAGRRIKPSQQFADHDQQLQVGRLVDKALLGLIFVVLGGLIFLQYILGVGVKLIALVAVLGLA